MTLPEQAFKDGGKNVLICLFMNQVVSNSIVVIVFPHRDNGFI